MFDVLILYFMANMALQNLLCCLHQGGILFHRDLRESRERWRYSSQIQIWSYLKWEQVEQVDIRFEFLRLKKCPHMLESDHRKQSNSYVKLEWLGGSLNECEGI